MKTRLLLLLLSVLALFTAITMPAAAVIGGQPDGNRHPYSVMVLWENNYYCSGTLISPTVVLTAGHCTDVFSNEVPEGTSIMVSFDERPELTADWFVVNPDDWSTASTWYSHPDLDMTQWPNTIDVGVVILDEPVNVEPAQLPEPYQLNQIIPAKGKTNQRFDIVGYGISGYRGLVPSEEKVRKVATVRAVSSPRGAILDGIHLYIQNVPSPTHGGGCPGDSGGGTFLAGTDTLVAMNVGGLGLGRDNSLCGRGYAIEQRIDIPVVLDWLNQIIAAEEG